jgi:hypothetical protein
VIMHGNAERFCDIDDRGKACLRGIIALVHAA